jgi:cytochrome c-type biogenesis protein CcmF
MAVAPALPWRKASTELLRHRLLWPAWAGGLTIVACVLFGFRGVAPLLAFGLGAFAAAAAIRQLVLSTRRQGVHGFVGRANGGMIVHLGVVLIAIAFAASQSYGHHKEVTMKPGESASLAGHHITYLGSTTEKHPNKTTVVARVKVDGGRTYAPALSAFGNATESVGTPSVKTGLKDDVYLTLVDPPTANSNEATIGFFVQPLIVWLWIGGGLMAIGTLLSAWPGRRRRIPTQPASAPVPEERIEPETVGV